MDNKTNRTIFFTCLIDFPRENATFAAGYEEGGGRDSRTCCYLISQDDGRVAALGRDRLKWEPLEPDAGALIRGHIDFARRIGTPCGVSPETIRWGLGQYSLVRG